MMANPHALVEGVDHRVLRDPGQPRLHLRARRGRARHPPAAAGGRARRTPRATSATTSSAPASTSSVDRARRRRRLHLRRGDGAARLARGLPRPAAAAPAVPGRRRPLRRPTVVNNVESIASVPRIVRNGADVVPLDGHREVARASSCFSLSGHVQRPGPVRGAAGHHAARAARPRRRHARGPRAEVLDARRLVDAAAHRRAPRRPAGLRGRRRRRARCSAPRRCMVFDETTCVVRAVLRWTEFYAHESCGKCTPCREGTFWLVQILRRLEAGQRHRGGPRQAARHLRQHPRPVVLRARRRRDQPDHVVACSTSATSTSRTSTHGGCPFDPAAVDACSPRSATRERRRR